VPNDLKSGLEEAYSVKALRKSKIGWEYTPRAIGKPIASPFQLNTRSI